MSTERRSNGQLDQLLRSGLPATLQPPSAACLEAETLAAWSDGALAGAAAADVESHLSNCGRCQAVVAVLARTEPAAAAVVPLWHRWQVRWLLPLAAGAAAVLIWTVAPLRDHSRDFALGPPMARVEPQYNQAPIPAPEASPTPPPARDEQPTAPKALSPRAELRQASPPLSKAEPAATDQAAQAMADASRDAARTAETAPPSLPVAAAPPPRADLPGYRPIPGTTQQPQWSSGRGLGRTGQGAQTATSALARNIPEPVIIEATPVPSAIDRVSEVNTTAVRSEGRLAPAAPVPPPSPGAPPVRPGRVRWRILDGNRVERSTSDTAPWVPLTIDPPVQLSAGVAPSPSVCWLIGPNGVILRAVDGVTFTRISFPEATNLAAIRATDELRATVTTEDGRVFVTTNGGMTWTITR